jgi:hypothetical protein
MEGRLGYSKRKLQLLINLTYSILVLGLTHHFHLQNVARICFIVGMAIVAGVSVFLLERYIIIFATSFIGAYLFVFGLDLFVHTGFINGFRIILDHNAWHHVQYMINVHLYLMLGAIIVLTLLSCGWQYYWNVMKLHRFFGINVVEAAPAKA